jgi:hypothetical protein
MSRPWRAAAFADTPPPLAPLDPQQVQDQQDMNFDTYKPIPGVDWATSGKQPTDRAVTMALVAFDFPDQPFVITQPKGSDPFGNPQINPIARGRRRCRSMSPAPTARRRARR